MTKNELLSILKFIHDTRSKAVDCLGVACPDPVWKMVLFLVERHLTGRLVTTSSLAAASGVAYPRRCAGCRRWSMPASSCGGRAPDAPSRFTRALS